MHLPWKNRGIRDYRWLVELFFAAFVWTFDFFIAMPVKKLDFTRLPTQLTSSIAIFNKRFQLEVY
jgi:hypothetical protein